MKISDLGQAKFVDFADRQTVSGVWVRTCTLARELLMRVADWCTPVLQVAPGAVVYSAPEVLTGRYTAKIDVFSFGIVLIQMCTGLYPSIEDRVVHIGLYVVLLAFTDKCVTNSCTVSSESACKKFPSLTQLITSCVSLDPEFRPTAARARSM